MISGNASILNHQVEGRALRVFQGARGTVTYRSEFSVDQENPWYSADAPETNDGPLRKVIVFRLNPVDTGPQEPATKLGRLLVSHPNQVDDLPLERNESETTFVNPNQEPYEADRREARLVKAFADYLTSNGHQSGRQRILPPGESRPLFTDLHAKGLGLLIEAKGSVTRENIRMAIGQLADYSRFVDHTIRAILLPSEPREDLLALAKTQDCAVIWPEGKGFISTNPNALPWRRDRMVPRAPAVPDRPGTRREPRTLTDMTHASGPRPIHLVRGRSSAVGVGFEPTVTRATTVFKTGYKHCRTPATAPQTTHCLAGNIGAPHRQGFRRFFAYGVYQAC